MEAKIKEWEISNIYESFDQGYGALITEKMQKNVRGHGEKRSFLSVKM